MTPVGAWLPAMARGVERGWDGLGALVFPSACLACGVPVARPLAAPLCSLCRERIPRAREPMCPRCGLVYEREVPPGLCGPCRLVQRRRFRRARAAGPYEGVLKECLLALKHRGKTRLGKLLGELAYERCVRTGDVESGAAIVPVPLHWRRRRERGYNQAKLIARAVSRVSGVPLAPGVLRKRVSRPPQAELSAVARKRNAAGAYVARLPGRFHGASLLLVDDVLTTGATVEACAGALLAAGAKSVDVLTVARVGTSLSPGFFHVRGKPSNEVEVEDG